MSLLVLGPVVLVGCGGGSASSAPAQSEPSTTSTTTIDPGPGPSSVTAMAHLEPVITGLDDPIAVTARPQRNQLWVAERSGRIRVVSRSTTWNTSTGAVERTGYTVTPREVLDLSGLIGSGTGHELFDLAFSSDGKSLYVAHSIADGATVIAQYAIVDQMDYSTAVRLTTDAGAGSAPSTTTTTTTTRYGNSPTTATPGPIPRPRIDPTSRTVLLTIPQGTGGAPVGARVALSPDGYLAIGVGDADQPGRSADSFLGTILRIDPATPSGTEPYTVPVGNPGVAGDGAKEVWRTDVRDPLWFSFDRATGDLVTSDDLPETTTCAVGGYIYRGAAIPALRGLLVHADRCTGTLHALLSRRGVTLDDHALGAPTTRDTLVRFGQDDQGELVAISSDGTLSVIMGGR